MKNNICRNGRCKTLDELPLLLTVAEVAAALGIGRHKAYALVQMQAIKSVRIGKQIRVLRDDLARFLCQN